MPWNPFLEPPCRPTRVSVSLFAILSLLQVASFGPAAFASFGANGTDNFSGILPDAQTWTRTTANTPPSFAQNNGMTIHALSSGPPVSTGFYTTISPLVPVGGSVWAEVRVNNAGAESFAALSLDTSSAGVLNFNHDSIDLGLDAGFNQGLPDFNMVYGGERQTAAGRETSYGPVATLQSTSPTLNGIYVFQIERLSSSNVQFSLFSELGAAPGGGTLIGFLGSGTQGFVSSSPHVRKSRG